MVFIELFRAKLAVTFKGRLLHSTVYSDEDVADCNHSTVQRGREYDDDPIQTGHNNGHRPYQTRIHCWLLLPISMAGMRLGGGREVRSDRRESEVVLKGDNGWVVDQQGIDGYGNVG